MNNFEPAKKFNITIGLFDCAILIIVSALFAHSCTFPILKGWDDNAYILLNTDKLTYSWANICYWFTHSHVAHYSPLTMLSYMFDYNLWVLDGMGYHIQNLVWHLIAVLGIFHCFLLLKMKPVVAFFMALIFAIHPQRVESVIWLAERKDVICVGFYSWSVFFYLKSDKNGIYRFLAMAFFILALLAKVMAVSLPIVLYLYEFHRQRNLKILNPLKKLYPFFIVAFIMAIITLVIQPAHYAEANYLRQFLVSLRNWYWYIEKTLFPVDLCPIYSKVCFTNWVIIKTLVIYTVLCIICTVCWIYYRKKFIFDILPIILCYTFTLLPVIGFLQLYSINYADRYSYLPSVFILFGVGISITKLHEYYRLTETTDKSTDGFRTLTQRVVSNPLIGIVSGSVCIILLSSVTWFYSQSWKNIYALYIAATSFTPPNPNALGSLAEIEIKRKNYQQAFMISEQLYNLKQEWMTEENTIANQIKARQLQAMIFYTTGHLKQACKLLEQLKPLLQKTNFNTRDDYLRTIAKLADCYHRIGQKEKALEYYNQLINAYTPDKYEFFFYSGLRAFVIGDIEASVKFLEKAQKLKPYDNLLNHNLCQIRKIYEKQRLGLK